MSYEAAPATILVATHCACCGKDLVDAVSVERGVGPECAKRHGLGKPQGDMDAEEAFALAYDVPEATKAIVGGDARRAANVLVHRIALHQSGENVARWTVAIAACGFTKLADRVAKRLSDLSIEREGDTLVVKAPFNHSFIFACRGIAGACWDAKRKVRTMPASSLSALTQAIVSVFGAGSVVRMGGTVTVLA